MTRNEAIKRLTKMHKSTVEDADYDKSLHLDSMAKKGYKDAQALQLAIDALKAQKEKDDER
jgi:hypothetical protein